MPTKHTNNTNETDIFFSEISRLFAYLVGKEVIPRFDVLELRLDYALESAVFAMAMQPVLPQSVTSV